MAQNEWELKLNDVGTFGELSARPNPQGYIVLTVPDIETLIPILVRERGREFTEEELKNLHHEAVSIALTKELAEKMRQAREKHQ